MHRQTEAAILFRLASFPVQQLIFSVSSLSATRKHALLPEAAGISATYPVPDDTTQARAQIAKRKKL